MILVIAAILCCISIIIALVYAYTMKYSAPSSATADTAAADTESADTVTTSATRTGKHTGQLLAVLSKSLTGVLEPGTGAGKGKSFSKQFKGAPFPLQSCVATFDVMFEKGFDFGCRGKVGGLFVGNGVASGCRHSKDGASLRLMWEGSKEPVVAFPYTYVSDGTLEKQPKELAKKVNCGQDPSAKKFGAKMTTGVWYHIEIGIKLNTVGKNDGVLYMGFGNDTFVLDGVIWRTQNVPITKFDINSFLGGGCSTTRKSTLNLRNVEIHAWKD